MSEKNRVKTLVRLVDATSLVAGSMIGSGDFYSNISNGAWHSAAWLLIIWVVTGLITVAAALSYGELLDDA
jgi:APA family basic amino acid/polyamine antiporter